MKPNIYDQHRAAFLLVSAYVIVRDGKQVGTIAFKFPKDGAGRLHCFLHIHGLEMVKGTASGYGYDKKGAAFENACAKLAGPYNEDVARIAAGSNIDGQSFDGFLRDAGYKVWGAV